MQTNMYLTLNHKKLEVYKASKTFVFDCYKLTKQLPKDEQFCLSSQIRRAALSVHLNIAEGSSRKSSLERRRYFEIARGSIIEIDAALDIVSGLSYVTEMSDSNLAQSMTNCFRLLTGLINSTF
jgi:four helix bundle protein